MIFDWFLTWGNYDILMKKRHVVKRTIEEQRIEASYLVRKYVSARDLEIIKNPDFYPENTKKDRAYNNGVDHAKKDLRTIDYILRYLQPHYRMKILLSNELKNVMEEILSVSRTTSHDYTKKERDKALLFAVQMMEFSRHVIRSQMPKEFQGILAESSKPFVQLVKAISEFGRRDNIKDIPRLETFEFRDDFISTLG